MLRSLYRGLLRLHPPAFRQRFADEMLSIFDHALGRRALFLLLGDGLVSLARQWALRPEFWHELAQGEQPASDGIPSFLTLDPFRPRTAALVHGLALSAVVFCLTCFGIRYSWIHLLHVSIPHVEFESPTALPANGGDSASPIFESQPVTAYPADRAAVAPPAQVRSSPQLEIRTLPEASTPKASVIRSTAEARLANAQRASTFSQPTVRTPVRTPSAVQAYGGTYAAGSTLASGQRIATFSEPTLRTPVKAPSALQAYEGTYITESTPRSTILIAAENGHLTMSIAGEKKLPLDRVSETKFLVTGAKDCWLEFLPSDRVGEAVRQVELFQNGQHFFARRQ